MSEHITRRNQEMEKYVEIQPVVMEGFPDAHNVFLKATNQRFCISQYGCETKDKAEWLRDMLCVALAKIVVDSRHAQEALRTAPQGHVEREAAGLSQQLIEASVRPGVDMYTATMLLHASSLIERLTPALPSTECGDM